MLDACCELACFVGCIYAYTRREGADGFYMLALIQSIKSFILVPGDLSTLDVESLCLV